MAREGGSVQRSFTGGEQSPKLEARADLARFGTALELCENFVTLIQGGAEKMPGTRDVLAAQDNSRLFSFSFSAIDGFAIEISPANLHFFRDFGFLDAGGGAPYALASPFTAGEVAVLDTAQSADLMFLACGTKPIQQLARIANTNWTIGAMPVKNGPFRDPNLDQTQFLYTTHSGELTVGTSIDLQSRGAAPFDAFHVGAFFRVRVPDTGKYGSWTTQTPYNVGDIVMWNANWYKCVGTYSTKAGGQPPVHLIGTAWDGDIIGSGSTARQWLYLHSGFGIVKVTGYTSASHVTATVQSYCPSDLIGTSSANGTWRWEEGSWSDYRGHPRIIGFHKKRLYALSNAAQPTHVWAGVIDDFPNFDDSRTDATNAFGFDLEADSGQVNIPQWLVSAKRLAVGTSGNEFVISSSDVTSPITPTSADPESATTEGSAPVPAINVEGPIFVGKDGKRLNLLGYDLQTDNFVASDLTVNADHIAGPGTVGFKRLAWLRDPYRLICALRSDGLLTTCSYRKDQNVTGWHRHPKPNGFVEDICVAPSPAGIRQDLWLIVQRVLPAGTVRRVESLTPFFERGDLASTGAWFVDGGLQYSGAPATVISGIPAHLIGATVKVRADGQNRPDAVVADNGGTGKITLDRAASLVTLGLGYTARLRSLRYDAKLEGKKSRVAALLVDVVNAGVVTGAATGNFPQLLTPAGGAGTGAPAPLQTQLLEVPLPSGWSDDGQVEIVSDDTGPCSVRALRPTMQVAA